MRYKYFKVCCQECAEEQQSSSGICCDSDKGVKISNGSSCSFDSQSESYGEKLKISLNMHL